MIEESRLSLSNPFDELLSPVFSNPFDELLSPVINNGLFQDFSRNVVRVDSAGVLQNTGPSRYRLEEADIDLLKIIEIIISEKGWFRGSSYRDEGMGKYMFVKDVKRILEENSDWIKTKKTSINSDYESSKS